ncbi:PadR family transcriptional regulator [Halobacillus sp. BAB-2008]|nr:PadR family transcriptional regulator [Halobacillus sp. BAB-2008]
MLILIAEKDQYGYELAQNISEHMEIGEGSLYPLLRRLTKEAYLDTYMAPSREGPARKYYQLTEEGTQRMETLMEEWTRLAEAVNGLMDKRRMKE